MTEDLDIIKKNLINAPLEEIKSLISQMYIDEITKEHVEEYCKTHRYEFSNTDIFTYLKKEWLNEVFSMNRNSEEFQSILAAPSSHFYHWVTDRVNEPFSISARTIRKLASKFGFEFVASMEKIRWKQEIAWARKMRYDPNDEVCVLSALFLISAKKKPNQFFGRLIEVAFDTMEEENYFDSEIHELNEEEILNSDITSQDWNPLFLRLSKDYFNPVIEKMPIKNLAIAAKKAREDFESERYFEDLNRNLFLVNKYPLSSRLLVVMRARSMNLTPNELVTLESSFKEELQNKTFVQQDSKRMDQSFMHWLKTVSVKEVILDRKHKKKLKQNISNINSYWLDNLPNDLKDLGGQGKGVFSRWRSEVLSDRRETPLDPVIDYLYFLIDEG